MSARCATRIERPTRGRQALLDASSGVCWTSSPTRAQSPYYSRLYRDVPVRLSEIGQLPVVTKAELMSHFNDWVTDPSVTRVQIETFLADPGNFGRDFLGRYVVCRTSGATGIPPILLHDHTALVVYNVLGYARSLPALLLSPRPLWALLRGRSRLAAVFVTGGRMPPARLRITLSRSAFPNSHHSGRPETPGWPGVKWSHFFSIRCA